MASKSMLVRANKELVERFRQLVQGMSRESLVYRMLKKELGVQGHWKNKVRGKRSKERARQNFIGR